MGPSLDYLHGIILSRPDMLFLVLNPALLYYGNKKSWALLAIGSVAAIVNTRLGIAFSLLALLFVDFSQQKGSRGRFIMASSAFIYMCFEVWMMYQAFVLGWVK